MLSGNKGEWSEVYVFLKLLAEGNLYAADENLNRNPNLYFPIIKILREEIINKKREYVRNSNIKVLDANTRKILVKVPIKNFVNASNLLLNNIRKSTGAFAIPEIEKFLNIIDCESLSDSRGKKEDINIIVHDLRTGLKPLLGFSIKSMLGGSSTLFNAGNTTNFIYKLIHPKNKKIDIKQLNKITNKPIISNRFKQLLKEGFEIKFQKIESTNFQLNLILIDTLLPDLLSFLLLNKYIANAGNLVKDLTKKLTEDNPLNYDLSKGHQFYEYRIKNFLTEVALGMVPSKKWSGKYDATGGFIIVKTDGDLVCYHIYNRYEFQEYLFNNTWLDQASTSRYGFGNIYELKNETFIKLNLQVRFI